MKYKKSTKQKLNIKKTIMDTIIVIIVAFVLAYGAYEAVQLLMKPSNAVIVQEGTVESDEPAVRICYKR
ncbi:MAG: hypothetical protein FWC53_03270 [Firmicutes bacterium]|nr:hypothetical protein [Bacillota bacterium]